MANQRPIISLFDSSTGQAVEREMTVEEFAIYENTIEDAQVLIQEHKAKEQQKEAAVAKLVALGLTEADLRALGL
jgi:hypothetical protein